MGMMVYGRGGGKGNAKALHSKNMTHDLYTYERWQTTPRSHDDGNDDNEGDGDDAAAAAAAAARSVKQTAASDHDGSIRT